MPAAEVAAGVEVLCRRIAAEPDYGHVHGEFAATATTTVVDNALAALGSYHTRPAATRHGDQIAVGDLKLLYYYQNRTAHIPSLGGRS